MARAQFTNIPQQWSGYSAADVDYAGRLGPGNSFKRDTHQGRNRMTSSCRWRPATKLIVVVLILLFQTLQIWTPMWAQANATARIAGAVSDSAGAAVVNATISVTHVETGLVRKTISGSDGSYVLPTLPIGPYVMQVTAPGFGGYEQSGIDLHVGDSVAVNVALKVGSTSEQVSVTGANANMVEVEKPSVSEVIDQNRIVGLPLNGRQATQLLLLAGASAAVTTGNPIAFDLNGSRAYALSTPYAVAGGQANTNNWLLDGADNTLASVNVSMPYPFPDALQEFQVETSSRSARSGIHPGSVINAVTKSGTNQFHGDLFEFLRNGDVNARNYFAKSHDTLKRNQFGGTAGSRIVRDKLFLFGGYQGTTNRSTPPQSISFVPTQSVLNGDFSTILGSACQSRGAVTLIDPTTGAPFPNNQIPTARFNSQALALLHYVPVSSDPCGKVVYGIPTTGDEQQGIGRVDWIQSSKNIVFGRYFIADYTNPAIFDGKNILPAQRTGFLERGQALTVSDTYTLNPTTVNSMHVSATRMSISRGAPPNYVSPEQIGLSFPGITDPAIVSFTISGYFATGKPGVHYRAVNNSFQVAEGIDMIRGRHHLSFGGEFFRNQMNENNYYARNGGFTFNGAITGNALADYMLGDMSSFLQSQPELGAWRQSVLGFYGEDTIRINPQLTVTAGLRWEPFFPTTDAQGRGSVFSPTAFAAGTKTNRYVNAPPGLLFNSDPGIPSGYMNKRYANLGPRLGIAWDPTGKGTQSIRASYSLIYDTPCIFYNTSLSDNAPWGGSVTYNNPPGGLGDPWGGYPGGAPFPTPYPPSSTSPFPLGNTYQSVLVNSHVPYMLQWNLSYEKQLGRDWLVSGTYIGNKSTHLWVGIDVDPAVFIPGTCQGKPCSTLGNTQQRRVLSLENPATGAYYGSVPATNDGGIGTYNALLLSLQHRFSHNFSVLANYTYSHCLDFEGSVGDMYGSAVQDPNNIRGDNGNCESDFRHIFIASFVATSPTFDQRWERLLAGNWQLSPIISARTGSWFTLYDGIDNSLTAIELDRPNKVLSSAYPAAKSTNKWLNPAAFALSPVGTYGDSSRNSLLAPDFFNIDVAVSRAFPLGEVRRLEARFEAFNATNHTNFAPPVNTVTSPSFGQIQSAADPRILQAALKFVF
jgi:hypothetical protein